MKTLLKENEILEIVTPYGDEYLINNENQIKANGLREYSKTWLFNGIANRYGHKADLKEILSGNTPILYKNGNPIYSICDIDNNTHRQHGNSKYHGIKYIRVIKA